MKHELVKSWMTKDVIAVHARTTVLQVHRLMVKHNIRRVLVLYGVKLIGIITITDIRQAKPSGATTLSVREMYYYLSQLPVGEVMTLHPITVSPNTTLMEAAKLMVDNQVSVLPVVNSPLVKEVVGIITESDIFRLMFTKQPKY